MSLTQILVFDPELSSSPAQTALIEAVWTLPLVQIADLRSEYADAPFDVDRERNRLQPVDTVILQITETAARCPLLDQWMDKVLALETPSMASDGQGGPVVRRLGAVIVAAPKSRADAASGPSGFVIRLLRRLRRAVESVGIEWLGPQIIDPSHGRRSTSDAISAFTRRLQGREPHVNDATAERAPARSTARQSFSRSVARWSAVAVLVSAIGQLVFSTPGLEQHAVFKAWSDLATGWLAVGLSALVASMFLPSFPGQAKLSTGLAAMLFGVQLLSAVTPDAGARVLTSIPSEAMSGAIALFAGLTVLALFQPNGAGGWVRSKTPGPVWPREG